MIYILALVTGFCVLALIGGIIEEVIFAKLENRKVDLIRMFKEN